MKADKETSSSNRNGAIDFLKFVASVILVLHHYQQVYNVFIDNGINFYSGRFYWGFLVDLFFMISGFFTFGAVTKITEGKLTFRKYYLHRYARLIPLVALAGVIYFFINNYLYFSVMGEYYIAKSTWFELLMTFLGMQVGWFKVAGSNLNPPMWYISSLLIGYLVIYLLVLLSRKVKINYIIPLIALILISMAGDLFEANLPFFESCAKRAYIDMSAGILLAGFLKDHKIKGFHYIFVALLGIAGAILHVIALDAQRPLFQRYALTFMFFPALLILFLSPAVKKVFSAKIWNVLGAASYDTYVLHVILLLLIRCADKAWGWGLSFSNHRLEYVTALAIFLVGLLSYLFVEPLLKKLVDKALRLS